MKQRSKTSLCGLGRLFATSAAFAAVAFAAVPAEAASVWEDAYIRIDGATDLNGDGRWTPATAANKHDGDTATAEIRDTRHAALANPSSQRLAYGSSDSGVISRSGVRIVNKDVVMPGCGGRTVNMPVLYFPQAAYNSGYSFENLFLNDTKCPVSGNEWTVLIRCRHEEFISTIAYVFGLKTPNLGGEKEIRLGWGPNPNNSTDSQQYLCVTTGNTRWAFTNIKAQPGKWVELAMVVHPSLPVEVNGKMTITNCMRFASAYEGETRLWRDYDIPFNHSSYTTNFTPKTGWLYFGGVRYGNQTSSNLDSFRGDIQLFGLWNRALSDAEIVEAFGGGSPSLFRLGEENCAAEMFGGAAPAAGATVTLDPLVNDKRDFPTVLTPRATFRIPFAVDKYATNTAHWVRFRAQSGSAAGTVAVALDGVALDPLGVSSGRDSYLWVPGEKFTLGDHVLTLSRSDNGTGNVKFDVIEIGGAICAGAADGSEADMASASTTASLGYFDYDTWYAADGNLKDFVRATQRSKNGTHRPTTIQWTLPPGAAEKFGMQFSYKFLYSTADSGGNEPLVFTVNGTQVHVDNHATYAKATTVFKVDADDSPFVDGKNTIHIDFAAANKNNWVDWDMLKIEPLRPKSPFVMVVR